MTSGTLNNNGQFWIGQGNGNVGPTGVMNMSGGTFNQHDWLAIGRDSSTGTLNMSGGQIIKDSSNNVDSHVTLAGIGTAQTATINQTGGDIIVYSGGNSVWIGETATGIYNISGGTLQAYDGVLLGQNGGNGTLNIQNGTEATGGLGNGGGKEVVIATTVIFGSSDTMNGNFTSATVNLDGGTLETTGLVAGTGTGTRTINLNGGLLQALGDSSDFMGGTAITANVQAGGAKIDTNGFNVTVATPLVSETAVDGGLTKVGAGILTLTGTNTYNGPTVVSAGSLAVNSSLGVGGANAALTVAQGATLAGTGTLNLGTSVVTVNGILAPGATPNAGDIGTLTVVTNNLITLTSSAALQFDITNAMTKDLVVASGAQLTLSGQLVLNGTVALNTPYTLFSGLVAEKGAFTSVTGGPANSTPTFTFNNGNYNVTFAAVPEPSTLAMSTFGIVMAAAWLRRLRPDLSFNHRPIGCSVSARLGRAA